MEPISINHLAKLTGLDRRTVTKKLANVTPIRRGGTKGNFYDSEQVLRTIYLGDEGSKDPKLDLGQERAKLAKAQTAKTELEVSVLAGKLIKVEDVQNEWSAHIVAFRSKILSIPSKVGQLVHDTKIEERVREFCHEALEELTGYFQSRQSESRQDDRSASETDNKRVGRSKQKTLPRKRR